MHAGFPNLVTYSRVKQKSTDPVSVGVILWVGIFKSVHEIFYHRGIRASADKILLLLSLVFSTDLTSGGNKIGCGYVLVYSVQKNARNSL